MQPNELAHQIMSVIKMSGIKATNEWFPELVKDIIKTEKTKSTMQSCKEVVNVLVDRLINLNPTTSQEETGMSELAATITTLKLLCDVNSDLLVEHAYTFSPYLASKVRFFTFF